MTTTDNQLILALEEAIALEKMRDLVVQITGGRDFLDEAYVFSALDAFHNSNTIVLVRHGGARGADYLAGKWARQNDVAEDRHLADWARHGRRAGVLRNQAMLDATPRAAFLLAFPGGRGTAHMTEICTKAGLHVVTIRQRETPK